MAIQLVLVKTEGTGAVTATPLLLVHSDDTNGSTTFVDSSSTGATISISGTVTHSTEQAKFGGSSMKFADGALTVSDASYAVGTGDFTIDFWAYRTGNMGTAGLASGGIIDGALGPQMHTADTTFSANVWNNTPAAPSITNIAVPINTWTHFAFVREGGNSRVATNGVFSSVVVQNQNASSTQFAIGARYGNGSFRLNNTYIDEFRFASGAAWSADFTPPTAPY